MFIEMFMKENTIIIRNGKIYILQPVADLLDDVCDTCDLQDLCMNSTTGLKLLDLCESFTNPDMTHFKEFKGKIIDLIKKMK